MWLLHTYTLRQKIADFLTDKRIKFKTNNFSEPGNKFSAHQSWIANYREIFKTHLLYFLAACTVGLQSHGCCGMLFCRWAGRWWWMSRAVTPSSSALLSWRTGARSAASHRTGAARPASRYATSPNSNFYLYLIMNIIRHSFQLWMAPFYRIYHPPNEHHECRNKVYQWKYKQISTSIFYKFRLTVYYCWTPFHY